MRALNRIPLERAGLFSGSGCQAHCVVSSLSSDLGFRHARDEMRYLDKLEAIQDVLVAESEGDPGGRNMPWN